MTSDKPGEFDDCGCPSHVDQNGQRTVNPNCEHLRAWLDPMAGGFQCSNCGLRFVPCDVLEDLRTLVVATRDCVCFPGDSPCEECTARIETAARRIEEVLGPK
jgi:hypothetical protein